MEMKMMLVATALWLLAAQPALATPSSSYCPTDESACYSSPVCQWSAASSRCVSSIPCALETDQTLCEQNTWGCSWQANNGCAKTNKQSASSSSSSPPCGQPELLYNQQACAQVKVCFWQSFRCQLRPTIVLSVADDLGWYDVGWNNPRARTPVLNALRSRGVALNRHYASRFCAPSRAMLMTGKYAWRMGLQTDLNLNPVWNIRCASGLGSTLLPQALKDTGGYATLGFGKWHLGHYRDDAIPTARGFDKWIGYYGGGIDNNSPPNQFYSQRCACDRAQKSCNPFAPNAPVHCAFVTGMVNCTQGQRQQVVDMVHAPPPPPLLPNVVAEEDTADLFLANRMREQILLADAAVPLFLYLAWGTPHEPEYASDAYKASIQRSMPAFGTDAPLNKQCDAGGKRLTHLAMVMTLDYAHAVVIDALEQANRFDTTVFVFLSDNGGNSPWRTSPSVINTCAAGFNYPLRGAKFTFWEGGVRTLGFVYSTKYMMPSKRGMTFRPLIAATDWRRTLLKASGTAWARGLDDDGIDYWSPLSGFGVPSRETRTELPLQVWQEQSRHAMLFYLPNDIGTPELYKLIVGNPFSGWGAGNVGSQVDRYSHGEIDQPPELSTSEVKFTLDAGFRSQLLCTARPCLFNLDRDPQELADLSQTHASALRAGMDALAVYQRQYVRVVDSGLCSPGYYATDTLDTMDFNSIAQAKRCAGWVPWMDSTGSKLKSGCD